MRKIELLAPAGSKESLIAAVQNGADAVYLGGAKFSARAYASNFDKTNMEWAIDYCHVYGVKVHVTMNTLIKDQEMDEALDYAKFLHNAGVDALIIQDYGLAYNLKNRLPEIELHASTQMTVHNAEGAKFLNDRGFQRIVLSRELHIDEVKKISKEYGIETEMFIHGALCICYSGQCLMSSTLGGRSGNRGRCAQPCRLPYKVIDNKGKNKPGYIMSPKDVCTIEDIRKIINSGTSSLKIEGRMKRPEYVAGIVSSYRKAIDAVYEKIEMKKESISAEKKKLMQLFNREGFSKAYLFGNIGRDMMSFGFPKNTGVMIGKVKNGKIQLQEDVVKGDGIRIKDSGFIISSVLKDEKEVKKGLQGESVQLKPRKYKNGDVLYKTSDSELNSILSESYKNDFEKKINLTCSVEFRVGYPIKISTKFQKKSYSIMGEVVQEAVNKPIAEEKVIKSFQKSGNTPFKFEKVDFSYFEDGFIPISAMNDVRRRIIDKIESDIKGKLKNDNRLSQVNKCERLDTHIGFPEDLVVVRSEQQLNKCRKMNVKNICVDFTQRELFNINPEQVDGCYIKVNNIIKDKEYNVVKKRVSEVIPHIKGIVTSNLGIISEFGSETSVIGDYKLNIFNKHAVSFFENQLDGIYLSAELNKREINEIASVHYGNIGVLAYGEYELMVSEYCPIGSTFGGKNSKNSCNRICEECDFKLRDRLNIDFPIRTDIFCRSYIYNSVPLDIIFNKGNFEHKGIRCRIDLLEQNAKESEKVIAYLKGETTLNIKATKGQFNKGVE